MDFKNPRNNKMEFLRIEEKVLFIPNEWGESYALYCCSSEYC